MSVTDGAVVTVVQPGGGESVPIPGFGAVFKLTSGTTGESLEAVKHSAEQVIIIRRAVQLVRSHDNSRTLPLLLA